jgi:hypothetical protein
MQLRRRAAEELMTAGRIDEAKALIREDLRSTGFSLRHSHWGTMLSLLWHRLLLRARRFKPASGAACTAAETAFLDHMLRLILGISFVDALTSAELAARFVLRALDTADPAIAAKGLILVAGHAVTEAPHSKGTAHLIALAEMRAAALQQPELEADILIVRALRAYFGGEWHNALLGADRAAGILHDELPAMVWEQWTCRYIASWSLFFLGDWTEMERRVRAAAEEARERGHIYAMAGTCSPFGVVAWLCRGEVDGARRALQEVVSRWSVEGVQFQHFWFLNAETLIHLYVGDAQAAWELVQSRWQDMASSLTMRIPVNRLHVLYLRGCAALAAARVATGQSEVLGAEAARVARRLERVGLPPARPLSHVLRAGVAALTGDADSATRHGTTALAGLEELEMHAYAAALCRQLARLRGDALPAFMPGQPVTDPDAIARMLAPELLVRQ